MRVVFDTSVLVAASRSNRGASYELVRSVPLRRFELCLSVALYVEWMDALSRPENLPPGIAPADAVAFLRYLASLCHVQLIYFCGVRFCPIRMTTWFWKGGFTGRVFASRTRWFMSAVTINLPESLFKQIDSLAAAEGYTVERFLATAAGEKLAVLMTASCLRSEAAAGRREAFVRYMAAVPDAPVVDSDRIV